MGCCARPGRRAPAGCLRPRRSGPRARWRGTLGRDRDQGEVVATDRVDPATGEVGVPLVLPEVRPAGFLESSVRTARGTPPSRAPPGSASTRSTSRAASAQVARVSTPGGPPRRTPPARSRSCPGCGGPGTHRDDGGAGPLVHRVDQPLPVTVGREGRLPRAAVRGQLADGQHLLLPAVAREEEVVLGQPLAVPVQHVLDEAGPGLHRSDVEDHPLRHIGSIGQPGRRTPRDRLRSPRRRPCAGASSGLRPRPRTRGPSP